MKYALLFLAFCVVAACQTTPDYREPRALLETSLDACATTHSYDREAAKTLKNYQLGHNEIAWRQCAYTAIETHMIPHTPIPELYRQIIAEDTKMTAKIQKQSLTRAARRARLDTLIADIEKRERTHQEIRKKELEALRLSQAEQQRINDIISIQQQFIRARVITLQGMR